MQGRAAVFGGGGVTSGGSVIPGATAYAVLRVNGSGVLTGDSSLLFGGAAAGTGLAIAAGTATTDVQALTVTQTYNNAGVTFTTFKVNATNTASNSASKIADFQQGGASIFAVTRLGCTFDAGSPNFSAINVTRGAIALASGSLTSTQEALSHTVTFNGGGVVFTGWKLNITNTASAAGTKIADLQVGGTSLWGLNISGLTLESVTASITASTTQTQGQGALTRQINQISVCANANDTVTLPSAAAGMRIVIINRGAQTLQIFPASGDAINGAAVNTSTTLASGAKVEFTAYDTTNWESL